jgi:hypothetical protein
MMITQITRYKVVYERAPRPVFSMIRRTGETRPIPLTNPLLVRTFSLIDF